MTKVTPYNNSESKKKQVTKMFDNIAESYDFLNHSLSLGMDNVWRKIAIKKLVNNPNTILDIATGTGDFAISASKHTNAQISGIDISQGMLDVGIEKIKKKGLEENLLQGVESSKKMPFEKVLFGLGIRYVGKTVSKVLVKHFKTIEALMSADFETLVAVDEIGDKIAESVILYFESEVNQNLIANLKESGLQFISTLQDIRISEKLKGEKIVVSGVFTQFSRVELKKMIEEHGGKNIGSISKNTTFVLAGDNMGPSKKQKAEDLKIPLINETEFLEKIS